MNPRHLKWSGWPLHGCIAIAAAVLLSQFNLDYIEAFFFDMRFRLRPTPAASGKVELVLMDQTTVELTGGVPGYRQYQLALERILAQNPKAVVITPPLNKTGNIESNKDLLAGGPDGTDAEAKDLAVLLDSHPEVYQITSNFRLRGQNESFQLGPPFEKIKTLSFSMTEDRTLFAKDGVTRRAFTSYQDQPLASVYLAGLAINQDPYPIEKLKGQFDVYDSRQLYVDFLRHGSLSTTKLEDIIRAVTPEDQFKDKIVIIGEDFGKTSKNYASTPYSRDPKNMTLLEVQGQALDTVIRNSAPVSAPPWVRTALVLLIAFFTIRLVITEHPLRGITKLFGMTLTFLIFAQIMFWAFGILIPMAHPMLGIFLCYYFFIPYRLIKENRRSWEYYQKNQLLRQVEELKTNFISMMSHDLKTPIARIQGMTEVITKDGQPLSSAQQEAIDHIRASSEDLHRFINSILNYARIESEGVALHVVTKDINEIIKEVIRKHDFLAKLKHIQVVATLEPLFPIQVDPDLLRQVVSNLVENAIKYSPDHSKVTVTTQETEGFVRIEVTDQGDGIAPEDLQNIFMKFFRSRNAKSSPIKGSGLGLYLAKYFVELHKGTISVKSAPRQGSTFTVDLPLGK